MCAGASAGAKESASKPFSICQQNATSIMLLRLQIIQITVQYYTWEYIAERGRCWAKWNALVSIAFGAVLNINVPHSNNTRRRRHFTYLFYFAPFRSLYRFLSLILTHSPSFCLTVDPFHSLPILLCQLKCALLDIM